jgi:hypothetical protein
VPLSELTGRFATPRGRLGAQAAPGERKPRFRAASCFQRSPYVTSRILAAFADSTGDSKGVSNRI